MIIIIIIGIAIILYAIPNNNLSLLLSIKKGINPKIISIALNTTVALSYQFPFTSLSDD